MAISPLNSLKDVSVPSATGADEDFSTKYSNALDKISQTLDERSNQGPNWFNVAAGFFKPTRSGSFGESAGNAAEAYGRDIERQRSEALPIAQMRAEIMGKGYELDKQKKGMQILGNIMGTTPGAAQNALSTGNVPVGLSRMATPQQLTMLMMYDPKTGTALKTGMEAEAKNMENAIKLYDTGVGEAKAFSNLSDDLKAELKGNLEGWRATLGLPGPRSGTTSTLAPVSTAPVSTAPVSATPTTATVAATGNNGSGIGYQPGKGYATYDSPQKWASANDALTSQYLTPRQGQAPMTPERFVGTWVTGDPTAGPSVQNGDYVKAVKSELANAGVALNADGSIPNTTEARQAVAIAQVKHETAPKQQGPFLEALGATRPASQSTLVKRSDETPAEFNARRMKVEEPQIKDAAEIAKGLSLIDPDSLTASNTDLTELKKIANRPDAKLIFAPFQVNDGDTYAGRLYKAGLHILQTGGDFSVGGVRAAVGINLEPVYKNLKLTDEQKFASARAENIIAQQVINNIIATKSKAFGGNRLTNYQDQQMSSLNANMGNIAPFIGAWATRRQVDNAALMAAQDEWVKFQRDAQKKNQPADPRNFLLSDTYLKDLPRMHKEHIEKVHSVYGQ